MNITTTDQVDIIKVDEQKSQQFDESDMAMHCRCLVRGFRQFTKNISIKMEVN